MLQYLEALSKDLSKNLVQKFLNQLEAEISCGNHLKSPSLNLILFFSILFSILFLCFLICVLFWLNQFWIWFFISAV